MSAISSYAFYALGPSEQERIRDRFLQGQSLPDLDIEILRSWQRCAREGRLPNERVEPQRLDRISLSERQAREHPLLDAARPVLQALSEAVDALPCGVLLTDREGVVLASRIPPHAHARLASVMQPGALLDEASVGTNAMAAAMAAARPVHVFGAEHYFENTRGLYCCAAPVFDATAQLVGALNVTATTLESMRGVSRLVAQAAASLEGRLVQQATGPGILQIQLGFDHNALQAPLCAVLMVNEAGLIVGTNRAARTLLSQGNSALQDTSQPFETLFATPLPQVRSTSPSDALALTLASGLRVCARVTPAPSPPLAAQRASQPAAVSTSPWPDFGDRALLPMLQQAARAFDRGLPVLLRGETGTGKEVAARALHQRSARAGHPFVAINCAAIPEALIESELFGHAEGAFTGARRGGLPGKLAQAQGGTLFLDEIGDMPLGLQTRLLRVLESREFVPLGSHQVQTLDVFVVSATHCDLEAAVQQHQFRADLYYRLQGVQLQIPPLIARGDYPQLLQALFEREVAPWSRMSEAARHRLLTHRWPGNVRELLHALRFLAATGPDEGEFQLAHLPTWLSEPLAAKGQHPTRNGSTKHPIQHAQAQDALRACDGHVEAAASHLGISRATLYRRLKAWRTLSAADTENAPAPP